MKYLIGYLGTLDTVLIILSCISCVLGATNLVLLLIQCRRPATESTMHPDVKEIQTVEPMASERRNKLPSLGPIISVQGCKDHSYQDGYSVDPSRGLYAIADGVSTSVGQALWASMLTGSYVAEPPKHDFESVTKWVEQKKAEWFVSMQPRLDIWRQELTRHQFDFRLFNSTGASATFLGVQFNDDGSGIYLAVGDCFFFKLSPLRDAIHETEFGYTPNQISTRVPLREGDVVFGSFNWEPDDYFLLATDAVAKYVYGLLPLQNEQLENLLIECEGDLIIKELLRLRDNGELDPDDYTAIVVNRGKPIEIIHRDS